MYDSDGCGYPGGVDMDFFAVYCDEDSDFEEEVDLNESGVCEAIQDNLNRGGWE